MRRREFILVGGITATWPLVSNAQQPSRKIARLGFIQAFRNENTSAFVEAMRGAGYIEGQNAVIEMRFYGSMPQSIPDLANELVALRCDVILANGPNAIQGAMSATTSVPIIGIDLESDPVAQGWAASLARPGKNLTGWFLDLPELGGKQIELLREAVPGISKLAVLWDASIGQVQFLATEAAAGGVGVALQSVSIRRDEELQPALDRLASTGVQGVVILSSPLILSLRKQIADLALRLGLPTISLFTAFPASGTLMAYGPDLPDLFK